MRTQRSLENDLFYAGICALVIGVFAWGVYHLWLQEKLPQLPCIFDAFLGVYCPGCGGTRACIALLHGHFLQSLWYHPFVGYSVALYGGFMLTNGLEMLHVPHVKGWKFHAWYLYGALGLILFHVLEKNILRLVFGIAM